MPEPMPSLAARINAHCHRTGLTDLLAAWRCRDHLTVLCYHRVAEPDPDRFQGFRTNISATPRGFRAQIEYLARRFSPITLADLRAFVQEGRSLPPRPALVTFDDGYRDNGEVAWPILRACGVPAAVFLATDHIGTGRPFIWDLAAYCFEATARTHADLPLLGPTHLDARRTREAALVRWVERLKRQPDDAKWGLARDLAAALRIAPPESAFRNLTLDWDAVVRLADEGVAFGGHTRTHPILARMPPAAARMEFTGSRDRIARETGRVPFAFAYPNGTRADFGPEHEAMARDAGYALAFSMEPGPLTLAAVTRAPLSIRRLYVGLDDDLPRLSAKIAGAARLRARLRQAAKSA